MARTMWPARLARPTWPLLPGHPVRRVCRVPACPPARAGCPGPVGLHVPRRAPGSTGSSGLAGPAAQTAWSFFRAGLAGLPSPAGPLGPGRPGRPGSPSSPSTPGSPGSPGLPDSHGSPGRVRLAPLASLARLARIIRFVRFVRFAWFAWHGRPGCTGRAGRDGRAVLFGSVRPAGPARSVGLGGPVGPTALGLTSPLALADWVAAPGPPGPPVLLGPRLSPVEPAGLAGMPVRGRPAGSHGTHGLPGLAAQAGQIEMSRWVGRAA